MSRYGARAARNPICPTLATYFHNIGSEKASAAVDGLRFTARARISNGIPVEILISTSGMLGGDGSDLILSISGCGFFIGNTDTNAQRASLRVSGDIEISALPKILEAAARMVRQLTGETSR